MNIQASTGDEENTQKAPQLFLSTFVFLGYNMK